MKAWTVDDVMTTDVVTAAPRTPYRSLVDRLVRRRVSGLPVVDDLGRVVGVVSEADLLRKVEYAQDDRPPRVFTGRRTRAGRAKAAARTAADLMTAPAVTVPAGTTIARAARLMAAGNVKRLPVVDDLGRLTGIVTRTDLLEVHLRADTAVRADVEQDVLRGVLSVEPGQVRAAVHDGVVTLDGRVDRRSAAVAAEHLARRVPGVVDVVSRLSYEVDDTDPVAGRGVPFGVA